MTVNIARFLKKEKLAGKAVSDDMVAQNTSASKMHSASRANKLDSPPSYKNIMQARSLNNVLMRLTEELFAAVLSRRPCGASNDPENLNNIKTKRRLL